MKPSNDDLIFGYTWEEIQIAQKGGKLRHEIKMEVESVISESDMNLFRKEGFAGLERMGFFGLIDKLKRSGIVEE